MNRNKYSAGAVKFALWFMEFRKEVQLLLLGTSLVSEDEDTGMCNFQNYTQKHIDEMEKLEFNYRHYAYPGKKVITEGKNLLLPVVQLSEPKEFYEYVSKNQDALIDYAEDYEPVKTFFGGEQQQIFMRALDMLEIYDDSKTYIVDEKLETIVAQMGQSQVYRFQGSYKRGRHTKPWPGLHPGTRRL